MRPSQPGGFMRFPFGGHGESEFRRGIRRNCLFDHKKVQESIQRLWPRCPLRACPRWIAACATALRPGSVDSVNSPCWNGDFGVCLRRNMRCECLGPLLLSLLLSVGRAVDQPQWGQAWTRNMVSEERPFPDSFDPKTGKNVQW